MGFCFSVDTPGGPGGQEEREERRERGKERGREGLREEKWEREHSILFQRMNSSLVKCLN